MTAATLPAGLERPRMAGIITLADGGWAYPGGGERNLLPTLPAGAEPVAAVVHVGALDATNLRIGATTWHVTHRVDGWWLACGSLGVVAVWRNPDGGRAGHLASATRTGPGRCAVIDLHAAITAKLDKLTLLANAAKFDAASARWTAGMFRTGSLDISDHIATWDPATVLRGLAEDRDILARHKRLEVNLADPDLDKLFKYFGGAFPQCLHGRPPGILVDSFPWPCADVLSLARRHGIEVQP